MHFFFFASRRVLGIEIPFFLFMGAFGNMKLLGLIWVPCAIVRGVGVWVAGGRRNVGDGGEVDSEIFFLE